MGYAKDQTIEKQPYYKDLRSAILDLQDTDPEKSPLLTNFYDRLIAKSLLPTLADIREFAINESLPKVKTTSRDKAISRVVKSLIELPVEQLKRKLDAATQISNRKDDRSLEAWTNLILDKEQRTKFE